MMNLKENIIKSTQDAEIHEDPFDHLYIENFFEHSFYEEILANIPNINVYGKIASTGRVSKNYNPSRYILDLQADLNKLNNKQQNFWKNINDILSSQEYWIVISKKFKNALTERFKFMTENERKIINEKSKIYFKSQLVKDFTKYQLGAHTDSQIKLISFLFYLPKDDDLKEIGTALYMPKDILENEKSLHYSEKDTKMLFRKVKTCEFKKNSVLVFPRTNYSYHGVEEVNILQQERNLFLANFFGQKI